MPLLFLTLAGPARAGNIFTDSDPEPAGSTPAASTSTSSGWYGWQILLADVGSLSLVVAGGVGRSTRLVEGGLGGWIGGGAVVHLVHGNAGRGMLSVVLRFGLPVLGAVAGSRISGNCQQPGADDECGVGPMLLGMLAGALAADTVDVALLAREGQFGNTSPPTPPDGFPSALLFAPRDGGVVAGYRGRF